MQIRNRSSRSYDRLRFPSELKINLVMIGESGVGKSCLVQRCCQNEFPSTHVVTIGIDFEVKIFSVYPTFFSVFKESNISH